MTPVIFICDNCHEKLDGDRKKGKWIRLIDTKGDTVIEERMFCLPCCIKYYEEFLIPQLKKQCQQS